MIDLGIVIVNYNTCDDLRNCLQSLGEIETRLSIETIVVDNHSSDGSAEMVRSEFPALCQVIETDHNGGYSYANNIGFRALGFGEGAARREQPLYALLLNPDTIMPPDALDHVVAYMNTHEDIGVLGPKLVRANGELDRACRRSFPTPEVSFYRLSGLSKLFPKSRLFGQYNVSYLDPDEQADIDAVVGAFMLMRGDALDRAGLLDETFFMYGEDIDLCYRIKQLGLRVVYYPQVTVLHLKGTSSRKNSRQAIHAFYEAMKIFYDKHYRTTSPRVVSWMVDGGVWAMQRWALLSDRLRGESRRHVASA